MRALGAHVAGPRGPAVFVESDQSGTDANREVRNNALVTRAVIDDRGVEGIQLIQQPSELDRVVVHGDDDVDLVGDEISVVVGNQEALLNQRSREALLPGSNDVTVAPSSNGRAGAPREA